MAPNLLSTNDLSIEISRETKLLVMMEEKTVRIRREAEAIVDNVQRLPNQIMLIEMVMKERVEIGETNPSKNQGMNNLEETHKRNIRLKVNLPKKKKKLKKLKDQETLREEKDGATRKVVVTRIEITKKTEVNVHQEGEENPKVEEERSEETEDLESLLTFYSNLKSQEIREMKLLANGPKTMALNLLSTNDLTLKMTVIDHIKMMKNTRTEVKKQAEVPAIQEEKKETMMLNKVMKKENQESQMFPRKLLLIQKRARK